MLADVMLGWSLSPEPHLSLNEQSVTAWCILLKKYEAKNKNRHAVDRDKPANWQLIRAREI